MKVPLVLKFIFIVAVFLDICFFWLKVVVKEKSLISAPLPVSGIWPVMWRITIPGLPSCIKLWSCYPPQNKALLLKRFVLFLPVYPSHWRWKRKLKKTKYWQRNVARPALRKPDLQKNAQVVKGSKLFLLWLSYLRMKLVEGVCGQSLFLSTWVLKPRAKNCQSNRQKNCFDL